MAAKTNELAIVVICVIGLVFPAVAMGGPPSIDLGGGWKLGIDAQYRPRVTVHTGLDLVDEVAVNSHTRPQQPVPAVHEVAQVHRGAARRCRRAAGQVGHALRFVARAGAFEDGGWDV